MRLALFKGSTFSGFHGDDDESSCVPSLNDIDLIVIDRSLRGPTYSSEGHAASMNAVWFSRLFVQHVFSQLSSYIIQSGGLHRFSTVLQARVKPGGGKGL